MWNLHYINELVKEILFNKDSSYFKSYPLFLIIFYVIVLNLFILQQECNNIIHLV